MAELDRYDDSYVILTADHGVSFRDQELWRGPSPNNIDELLWVPLLMKEPGQSEGRLSDVNSESIDLMPTIVDAVGIKTGWRVDGRSLLEEAQRPVSDKRFVPDESQGTLGPDEGERYATIDGVRGLRSMLAGPPASAVPSDDPLALYRLPPYLDLTGRSVGDLPRGSPAEWRARLVDGERYDDVDVEAPTVPVYISGVVQEPDTALREVVVAVNGVIGGWGRLETDYDSGETRFAVLVPESFCCRGPTRSRCSLWAIERGPSNSARSSWCEPGAEGRAGPFVEGRLLVSARDDGSGIRRCCKVLGIGYSACALRPVAPGRALASHAGDVIVHRA